MLGKNKIVNLKEFQESSDTEFILSCAHCDCDVWYLNLEKADNEVGWKLTSVECAECGASRKI